MRVERCLLACLVVICVIYTYFSDIYAVASKDADLEEVELVFVDDDGNRKSINSNYNSDEENDNEDENVKDDIDGDSDGTRKKGKKGKAALVIPLVEKNFEMFTQAGSQQSGNTWVVLFYSMKCKPCEYMKYVFETASTELPGVVLVCFVLFCSTLMINNDLMKKFSH